MRPKHYLTLPHINFVPILVGNLLDLLCGGFRQGSSDGDVGVSSVLWVVFQRKVVYSANAKFFLNSNNISMCMAILEGSLNIPSLRPARTGVGYRHMASLPVAQVHFSPWCRVSPWFKISFLDLKNSLTETIN